ncbi:hypothetical protein DSM100238_0146 [Bifidobacterium apri]|uniref:Uncharacterized protein n=1 Tax=Bifidobacterium apri TaxID=1769423 RepID=A0A6A2W342_9BIFI|nr:hypothetical protein DSM100238_0146 [Bifidobacterium apri]
MNQYEHHSHISITRHTREGVTRTDVHIARLGSFSGEDAGAANAGAAGVETAGVGTAGDAHECFDPESCCDAQERALIAMMRAYLRPQAAPECLIERLHRTLDACCREEECEHHDVRGADGRVVDFQPDDAVRHVDAANQASSAVVVRRVQVPGTEIVTVADLSVPEGWTFPTYPDVR